MEAFDNGADLIRDERLRQELEEAYTLEHDDLHTESQLARAAVAYIRQAISPNNVRPDTWWPWSPDSWNPSEDPIRNLVKAGALIAAEIDRRQRAAVTGVRQ